MCAHCRWDCRTGGGGAADCARANLLVRDVGPGLAWGHLKHFWHGQPPTRGNAVPRGGGRLVGKGPIVAVAAECYFASMGLILLIIVLLILFGGGGFYLGGPLVGGGGLGLILLICLIIYLMGGFRRGP